MVKDLIYFIGVVATWIYQGKRVKLWNIKINLKLFIDCNLLSSRARLAATFLWIDEMLHVKFASHLSCIHFFLFHKGLLMSPFQYNQLIIMNKIKYVLTHTYTLCTGHFSVIFFQLYSEQNCSKFVIIEPT